MRAPRPVAVRFAAFLALSLGVLAASARAETPPPVGLTLDGMSYVLARGAVVELRIEASHAQISPRTGRVELAGVHAQIASVRGAAREAGDLELVCERGALDLAAREFAANGRVAGRMQDGRTLRTERLRYRHVAGLVSSDAPVWLSDEAGDYRGGGFEYWVREDRFRLTGGASVVQGE